jgi:phosphopantetheine adenylyltransferase
VAGVYAIVSIICSQLSIPAEVDGGPGSVDATVVLIDHDRDRRFLADFRPAVEPNNTIIVDLPTFASAYGPWNLMFHVTSEIGLQVHKTYLQLYEGRQTLLQQQLIAVEGGLSMNVSGADKSNNATPTVTRSVVCLGGTFDHLHPGHKLLLTAGAFLLNVPEESSSTPSQYIIGITGDEMLKNKKYAEYVESWETRARNVLHFLSTVLDLPAKGSQSRSAQKIQEKDGEFSASFRDDLTVVRCVKIQDPFGPTITLKDIGALVVSGETRSGGQAVNDKRAEKGWQELEIFEVDVLDAEDTSDDTSNTNNFALKISSTAIRQRRATKKLSSRV